MPHKEAALKVSVGSGSAVSKSATAEKASVLFHTHSSELSGAVSGVVPALTAALVVRGVGSTVDVGIGFQAVLGGSHHVGAFH